MEHSLSVTVHRFDVATVRISGLSVGSRRGSPLDAWFRWNDTVEQMLVKGIRQTERINDGRMVEKSGKDTGTGGASVCLSDVICVKV
jgi:hypothetical protein